MFWLTLFSLYLMIGWLPTLLEIAGFARAQALRSAVLVQAAASSAGCRSPSSLIADGCSQRSALPMSRR